MHDEATGNLVPAINGSPPSTVIWLDFTLQGSSRQIDLALPLYLKVKPDDRDDHYWGKAVDWQLWLPGIAAPIACFVFDFTAGEHLLLVAPAGLLCLAAIGIASL